MRVVDAYHMHISQLLILLKKHQDSEAVDENNAYSKVDVVLPFISFVKEEIIKKMQDKRVKTNKSETN